MGYDHAILVRSAARRMAIRNPWTSQLAISKRSSLMGADGLIGARAGQTAGFYTKLITLARDLSSFKLYFTSVERVIAKCTAACNALPAGGVGEDRLEKYIADNLPSYISADFAPLEARIIDEDTYVQQGRDLEAGIWRCRNDLHPGYISTEYGSRLRWLSIHGRGLASVYGV